MQHCRSFVVVILVAQATSWPLRHADCHFLLPGLPTANSSGTPAVVLKCFGAVNSMQPHAFARAATETGSLSTASWQVYHGDRFAIDILRALATAISKRPDFLAHAKLRFQQICIWRRGCRMHLDSEKKAAKQCLSLGISSHVCTAKLQQGCCRSPRPSPRGQECAGVV